MEQKKDYSLGKVGFIDPEHIVQFKTYFFCRRTLHLLHLLAHGQRRRTMSDLTGIPQEVLRFYAQMCDLLRIHYLGVDTILLVREAGVKSVRQMRYQSPQKLYELVTHSVIKPGTRTRISPSMTARWVEHARELEIILDLQD